MDVLLEAKKGQCLRIAIRFFILSHFVLHYLGLALYLLVRYVQGHSAVNVIIL